MVMFSGVGSRGSEVLAMLAWEVSWHTMSRNGVMEWRRGRHSSEDEDGDGMVRLFKLVDGKGHGFKGREPSSCGPFRLLVIELILSVPRNLLQPPSLCIAIACSHCSCPDSTVANVQEKPTQTSR